MGPEGTRPAAVAETHAGVVFLHGDRAYKLKKPLDLGFLDFRTREAREAACHREVELNRRLAPDVYLGVADVHGPAGEVWDHLVVMRRMPDDRGLSRLLAAGVDVGPQLADLARLLAAFHARAGRGPEVDRAAGVEATAGRWAANTAEMAPFLDVVVPAAEVEAVDALAARYLDGRGPLLARRVADGRARDGHGDLLADDVFLLDDGPRVLDCIEFDDALRHGDVLADVAFLAMDLERLGRADLASAFLDAYRDAAGDAWPASLAHHHIAYRAQVRAKVAAIRAGQGHGPSAEEARSRLAQARRHLEEGRVRLVLVGGLPGTGKSTLAAGLGAALGAVVLRSDEVRKELAGLPPDRSASAPFGEGLYGPEVTAATYRALLDRAAAALEGGATVVLDASWTGAATRAAAREVGGATSSDVVELRCAVAPEVAADRLRQRAERGGDPSDADPAVARAMAGVDEPWPGAATVDTAPPPADVLAAALALVRAAPVGTG